MRILSFLGLGAVLALFATTLCLSFQDCYNWDCQCDFDIVNRDIYTFISLGFSIFFLIFCVLFLFKITELKSIQKKEASDRLLDSNLIETNYSIYELPSVKMFTKVGFVLSIGLFFFAFAMTKIQCIVAPSCNAAAACNDSNSLSYGIDTYLLGYGGSGIYFTMLTFVALLKSYPSKWV